MPVESQLPRKWKQEDHSFKASSGKEVARPYFVFKIGGGECLSSQLLEAEVGSQLRQLGKNTIPRWLWWLPPVIPATQEVEIRGNAV
jgi:hypothetical protein